MDEGPSEPSRGYPKQPPRASDPSPGGPLALGLLWGVYTLDFWIRFLSHPTGFWHWEEVHSPTAATALAFAEPLSRLPDLQYMPFCGGCSLETLAFLPVAATLGPAHVLWKLIPLGVGLAILTLLYRLGGLAGRAGALMAGALFVCAPTFYAHNRMIAWGNHFETGAIALACLLLWARLCRRPTARAALALGLAAGAGFSFCYAAAFAGPVLIGLFWMLNPGLFRSRVSAAALSGAALGLIPWAALQITFRGTGFVSGQPALAIYGKGLGDMLTRLEGVPTSLSSALGPLYWGSALYPTFPPEVAGPGAALALASAAGMLGALLLGLFRRRRQRPLALAASLMALAFLSAYLLVNPLDDPMLSLPREADLMRYLNPLIPLQILCLALLFAWGWGRRGRLGALAMAPACIALGVGGATALASVNLDAVSLRPLYLSALRPVALSGRLACGPGGAPLARTPDALLPQVARLPESIAGRRLILYGMGEGIARALEEGEGDGGVLSPESWVLGRAEGAREGGGDSLGEGEVYRAWGAALGGMSVGDRDRLFEGLAARLGAYGTWRSAAPLGGPSPRWALVTSGWEEGVAGELAGALLREDGGDLREVAESGASVLWDGGLEGPWRLGVAEALGGISADRLPGGLDASGEGIAPLVAEVDGWPAAEAEAWMAGVGRRYGARFGHSGAVRGRLMAGMPEPLGSAFAGGFDAEARRVYHWPAVP